MTYNFKVQDYLNEIQISYYKNGITFGEEIGKKKKKELDDHKSTYENKFQPLKDLGLEQLIGFGYSRDELIEAGFSENEVNDFMYKLMFHKPEQEAASGNAKTHDESAEDKMLHVRNCSVRRSKQSIYNYSRANSWDWFATFTFDDDRYDYDICCSKLKNFFKNFKNRKCREFEYLAVPEKHKDGAWHFHALTQGNIEPWLTPGYHKNRFILFPFSKIGINEVERIKNTDAAAKYITKYITKDLVDEIGMKNRYLVSRGLKKADERKIYSDVSLMDFILGNFPEYSLSYAKHIVQHVDVQYITLKRNNNHD